MIQQCEMCQKVKLTQPARLAELLFLTPSVPNQLITTDIAGPFTTTPQNNQYLLVIVDHFTKYIQLHAISNTKAETIANIIVNDWICSLGVPEQILSDLGTQYQSKLLEAVYEYLDILKLKTTAFHPQCDGQSERTIRTVPLCCGVDTIV